jgi:hypothetical protein
MVAARHPYLKEGRKKSPGFSEVGIQTALQTLALRRVMKDQ